jgi:hypothetical protein
MKANYTVPYGFKVSVDIIRDEAEDIAHVDVIAPMYVNKVWRMSHSYKAARFSDADILRDSSFVSVMQSRFPKG